MICQTIMFTYHIQHTNKLYAKLSHGNNISQYLLEKYTHYF